MKNNKKILLYLLIIVILLNSCQRNPITELQNEFKNSEIQSIVGGQPISIINRPYQVFIRGSKTGSNSIVGGGVVISPEWVLTAAHVVNDGSFTYSILAGSTSVDLNSFNGQTRTASQIIIHPDYIGTSTNPFNDIALVRLSSPLNMNENCHSISYIYPNELSYQEPGQTATVSGWGQVGGSNSSLSLSQLLYANMEIISPTNPYFTIYPFFQRSNKEIYTRRNQASQENVAGGDSGGPLTVNIPGFEDVLIGVVARGMPFNDDGPSAFTKVSNYIGWIQQHTGIDRPSISGPFDFCNTATYSVSNLQTGATVTWSASPNIVNIISTTNNQATITKVTDGEVTITASISNYNGSVPYQKTRVAQVGAPRTAITIDGVSPSGGSTTLTSGIYYTFSAQNTNGYSYHWVAKRNSQIAYDVYIEDANSSTTRISANTNSYFTIELYMSNGCQTNALVYRRFINVIN